jgi:amino acid transporter
METEKKKLTDTQLRIVQAVVGVLSAAALMIAIALSSSLQGLLSYTFVVIFLIITFGRRWIENKYRLRLNFFNLILINSIMIGILIYLIVIFYNPAIKSGLSDIGKLLIIIGIVLVIVGLGMVFPYIRYRKRTEKGIIIPIRIPEKTEEEQEAERKASEAASGASSIYRQIAEMKDELGIKEDDKPSDDESSIKEQDEENK